MATNNGPASLEPQDGRAMSYEDMEDGGSRLNVKGISKLNDKDRKIGHRRVNEEGEVSYKKIQTNELMASIQLGIQYSISSMTKFEERDLLMQDFMTVESTFFPRNGSQQTPAHTHSEFTFRTYAPVAFRYFHKLFGIQREDFLMSICHEPMRELCNPGASGSIFYLTNDDEFILKTVQHKEAEFLQKLLPGYFMNLNQNPHTLLPKFFGMFCYHCNQKNIRLTIMNNILPSSITMHLKFDLKGSTYKRKANKREREKKSPTFKDLDFMDILPEGVLLEAETYNALISTLRRDCRVLESFRIMDYSLLIGIHNLDQAAREEQEKSSNTSLTDEERQIGKNRSTRMSLRFTTKQRLVAHSTAMESIQAQTDPIDEEDNLPPGGIPARNHKGERLLLYLGIIDILQSYRIRKKLEHTLKAIILDGDTVSVHRPGFYAHRFLDFMADKVFKKIPSLDLPEIKGSHRKFRSIVSSIIALKHSPSKKGKRDSLKKRSTLEKETSDQSNGQDLQQRNKSGKASNLPAAVRGATVVQSPERMGISSFLEESVSENLLADSAPEPLLATPASYDDQKQETLNLPAVLWDKPPGSKTRVPPPVPPRSPKRPLDPTGAFASAAAALQETNIVRGGYNPNPRPDVIPGSLGADIETHLVGKGAPSKPKHKHVKKLSNAESKSLCEVASLDHGTPSHLSVTGGSGWNTPTPTWTEGTPSYTESTKSGSPFEGGLGNSSSRGHLTGLDGFQGAAYPSRDLTRRLPTCSFQETEM